MPDLGPSFNEKEIIPDTWLGHELVFNDEIAAWQQIQTDAYLIQF